MSTNTDLVLLTGATGHLGFRTLRYLLEYGYHVRAAVRSESKADTIRSNDVLKAMKKDDKLEFVTVPDFLVSNAFDDAVKGVKYIVHVASPITYSATDDHEASLIRPAVQGTLGVFESARKQPSVKRIVVTSSVVANVPFDALFQLSGEPRPAKEVYTAENRVPDIPGPYANPMVAYSASKIAALNRAEAWIATQKPSFDVIHIHPSFIVGRDDLTTSTADFHTGTNSTVLNIALGKDKQTEGGRTNGTNHVDDSARVHVLALNPKIAGNQSFFVSSSDAKNMKWEQVNEIVKKHFPEALEKGIFLSDGFVPTIDSGLDVRKTEETFGFKHKGFEEQTVSALGHYIELLNKEGKY